tara:strand:- start:168 stop:515 length:348 start_codon:yes stop_codon:yes gene_type:complete
MTKYYHGGYPHLRCGDFILSPDETGFPSTAEFGAPVDTAKVYVTTDKRAAEVFASCFPEVNKKGRGGRVYQVEPVGELEHDPDATGRGYSFQCPKARVLKCFERVPSHFAQRKPR